MTKAANHHIGQAGYQSISLLKSFNMWKSLRNTVQTELTCGYKIPCKFDIIS